MQNGNNPTIEKTYNGLISFQCKFRIHFKILKKFQKPTLETKSIMKKLNPTEIKTQMKTLSILAILPPPILRGQNRRIRQRQIFWIVVCLKCSCLWVCCSLLVDNTEARAHLHPGENVAVFWVVEAA